VTTEGNNDTVGHMTAIDYSFVVGNGRRLLVRAHQVDCGKHETSVLHSPAPRGAKERRCRKRIASCPSIRYVLISQARATVCTSPRTSDQGGVGSCGKEDVKGGEYQGRVDPVLKLHRRCPHYSGEVHGSCTHTVEGRRSGISHSAMLESAAVRLQARQISLTGGWWILQKKKM
jgi:hypothetical protein